jgi:hypothetical protein
MAEPAQQDDDEIGPSVEARMRAAIRSSNLQPLARVCLFGAAGTLDAKGIIDSMPVDERGGGGTGRSPLEYFRFQAKEKLEDWEYLAGYRFRQDFDLAHRATGGTVNFERSSLYATELARQHAAAGYHGKGAARAASAGDISVARLDAMTRRGQLAKECYVSFWLAEHIIGHEFWPKDVAAFLRVDPRYVGPRFREALQRIAGFYLTVFRSDSRAKTQVYHAPPSPDEKDQR